MRFLFSKPTNLSFEYLNLTPTPLVKVERSISTQSLEDKRSIFSHRGCPHENLQEGINKIFSTFYKRFIVLLSLNNNIYNNIIIFLVCLIWLPFFLFFSVICMIRAVCQKRFCQKKCWTTFFGQFSLSYTVKNVESQFAKSQFAKTSF